MSDTIAELVAQLSGNLGDNAYKASDSLGYIGSKEAVNEMIQLLNHPNPDSRHMASRTLRLIENNSQALEPLLEAIVASENKSIAGDLMMALEGFDVSQKYVEIFKLYLFGSYKVSMLAKELLDYKEFDITPRVLKKSLKHWNHYTNNVKQDDVYLLRKIEVEEILNDLKEYIDDQEA